MPGEKPFLEKVDGLAFFNGRVGQHGQDFGFCVRADEQQLGNGHEHLGVDPERAVDHAAPAPGAGIGGVVELLQGHFGQLFGLPHRGPDFAPGLEVFLVDSSDDFVPVGGDVSDLPHGGVDVAGFRADPAAGAGFQIKSHGGVQFALEQIQQIVPCVCVHGYPLLSLFRGRDKKECMTWLNGKKMRNRLAKNTCRTSMKEWPVTVTLSGRSG